MVFRISLPILVLLVLSLTLHAQSPELSKTVQQFGQGSIRTVLSGVQRA